VGRITNNVKGMTDPSSTPPISHQALAPANQAATEDTKPKYMNS